MMLLQRLAAIDPERERRRYKIVRRDTMEDVPGLILSASVETGLCLIRRSSGANQELDFGPEGLCIIRLAH